MKKAGIYAIVNTLNNKLYIGQTVDLVIRINHHKYLLKRGDHPNRHLQSAWNKYGESNFEFKLLKVCKPQYLDRFEKLYITKFKATHREYGYNIMCGGQNNRETSKEHRKNISIGLKKYYSENHQKLKEAIQRLRDMPPLTTKDKIRISAKWNHYGLYNVSKHKSADLKQGFRWRYRYHVDGTPKTIQSVNLYDLKMKVLEAGLLWVEHTLEAEQLVSDAKKDYNPYANYPSSTGYYRVAKEYRDKYPNGFIWTYHYFIGGTHHKIASLDINKLRDKVLNRGLEWVEYDEEKGWIEHKPTDKQSTLEAFM